MDTEPQDAELNLRLMYFALAVYNILYMKCSCYIESCPVVYCLH